MLFQKFKDFLWYSRKYAFIRSENKHNAPRFLILSYYNPAGINTVLEYISNLSRLSRFQWDIFNFRYVMDKRNGFMIPEYIDIQDYDGILIHSTVSYNPVQLYNLDKKQKCKFKDYQGLKILMKQDEHVQTNQTLKFISEINCDLVMTCIADSEREKVYPHSTFPSVKFMNTLTGYVSERLQAFNFPYTKERPLHLAYRGSRQPFHFGRLSYEKQEIGDKFIKICTEKAIPFDISNDPSSAKNGDDWFTFLASARASLAVESGASIFDFTGEVEAKCKEYLKAFPNANFEEISGKILAPYEGNVYYNQISPRHLEAVACRTPQVLYEGAYSGIFKPDIHYISLKKDYSNLDEVLAKLEDFDFMKILSDNAFQDIILNDKYSYSTFVAELDSHIESLL